MVCPICGGEVLEGACVRVYRGEVCHPSCVVEFQEEMNRNMAVEIERCEDAEYPDPVDCGDWADDPYGYGWDDLYGGDEAAYDYWE